LTLRAFDAGSSLTPEREGEDHEAILRRNRRIGSGGGARSRGPGVGTLHLTLLTPFLFDLPLEYVLKGQISIE
jgi:hypothetical protein